MYKPLLNRIVYLQIMFQKTYLYKKFFFTYVYKGFTHIRLKNSKANLYKYEVELSTSIIFLDYLHYSL